MTPGQFERKTAVVTGTSSGKGRATAAAFSAEGANVVVAARREENSPQTVTQVEQAGGRPIFIIL